MDAVINIHGKGGTAAEAEHYKHLFPACDVIGIAYKGSAPRDAGKEIHDAIARSKKHHDKIILIATASARISL